MSLDPKLTIEQVLKPEQVQRFDLKQQALGRANGEPFPGPLADAFLKDAIMVGDIAVRKVVARDWKILRAINSPVIRLIQDSAQNPNAVPEIETTDEEEWELAFQFTHTPSEVWDTLQKGREMFSKVAQIAVADNPRFTSSIVKLIGAAVMEQIRREWQTALKFKAEMEERGDVSFFREPTTSPTTGLAGGSNTSAASSAPSPSSP